MTSYKLVAVDLDGTLLDTQGVAHEKDLRALQAARDAGVKVTIVTGRLYSGTRPTAEKIGLKGPVACVDGSHIVSTETHKTLHCHALMGTRATALRDAMEKSGAATFLFAQDQVVYDPEGVQFLGYVSTWSTSLVAASRTTAHPYWEHQDGITAVVAVGDYQQIHTAVESIAENVGEHAQVAMFPAKNVDDRWGMIVRASGGNKGTALKYVADHYGVTMKEVVAVGDWINDIPMLEVAGRSFAMGHAPDAVKSKATDKLEETPIEGGGVARAIELAFGVRPKWSAYWALVVLGCGTPDWRSNVPAKYMEVAELHHASCGACHIRVEPGQRTRAQFEKALSKNHHERVKMRDEQWVLLIDYLSQTP